MRRFACSGDSATSKPPTAILPSVGGMKPVIMRMVVDLPAPFGPRKPSTSPRSTVNEMPSTARFAPKDFTRLSILIIKLGSFLTVQGGGLSPKNAAAPAAEASRRAILHYSFSFLPSPYGPQEKRMTAFRYVRDAALASLIIAASACSMAQTTQSGTTFEPTVGQAGKDVVWVPTPQALVDKMLDMAKVTPNDYVIDLGSGDGRTVITAAKRGARALGIEYNPEMVELSKRNAAKEGMTGKANFQQADLFKSDFSQASVITMFLLPDINIKLRPKILGLKPGTRVVSNSFTMGDWTADETSTVGEGCNSWCTAYLWIVPAKVDGAWKLPQGDLTLKQEFQKVSGTLNSGGKTVPLQDGKLRGNEISFRAGGVDYKGTVNGKRIEGTSAGGGWSATRGG